MKLFINKHLNILENLHSHLVPYLLGRHYLPRRNYFEKMNMTIDHFDGQASTLDYIACASG